MANMHLEWYLCVFPSLPLFLFLNEPVLSQTIEWSRQTTFTPYSRKVVWLLILPIYGKVILHAGHLQ